VAQKTLEKLEQRIVNARETIFVKDIVLPFKNILLIDDAVGSGASLNETAKKLKPLLPPSGKIFGFAITGSYKGFDVIREV
jgi:predicted amidophosphoribosyltransferase